MMLVYSVYCIRVGLHDIQVFNQRPQGCNNPAQCIQFDRMFSAPGTRGPGMDVFCSWYQVSRKGCFLLLVLGVLDRMFSAPVNRCPGQDVFCSWYYRCPGQDVFCSWYQVSQTGCFMLLVPLSSLSSQCPDSMISPSVSGCVQDRMCGVPDRITSSLGPRSPGQDYFFSQSQESRTRLLFLLVLGVPDRFL